MTYWRGEGFPDIVNWDKVARSILDYGKKKEQMRHDHAEKVTTEFWTADHPPREPITRIVELRPEGPFNFKPVLVTSWDPKAFAPHYPFYAQDEVWEAEIHFVRRIS